MRDQLPVKARLVQLTIRGDEENPHGLKFHFIVLAIVIGVILWMLVSAEMTYIRADKQKKNMMNKK